MKGLRARFEDMAPKEAPRGWGVVGFDATHNSHYVK